MASNTKMEAVEVSPTTNPEEDQQELHTAALLSAMGVLVGFLLVLIGFIISGWAWTCWTLNKLRKTKIHAR